MTKTHMDPSGRSCYPKEIRVLFPSEGILGRKNSIHSPQLGNPVANWSGSKNNTLEEIQRALREHQGRQWNALECAWHSACSYTPVASSGVPFLSSPSSAFLPALSGEAGMPSRGSSSLTGSVLWTWADLGSAWTLLLLKIILFGGHVV